MRIGQKLILGFVVIALLVGIVGYVAVNSGKKIAKSYEKVIDDTVPEILALKKIKIASLRMMMEAISFVAVEDERKFAAAGEEEEEFFEAKEEIERWEAEYEKGVAPDDAIELQFVKEIDILEERIEDLGVEIINLKKNGISGDEVLKKKDELEEAEESFLELIERVIEHEKGELAEESRIVNQNLKNSRNIVFATTGLVIILAIGIGYLISRAITNPLLKLKDAAVDIAQGNMDARIEVKPGDEIGELAEAFDNMRTALKVVMEEYEKREEK